MRKELGLDSSLAWELAKALRASLRMIHFYTSNEKEARAWALKAGSTALDAADVIHSDMAKGFIRAEVGQVDEIVRLGGLKEARKANILHQQGRDHEVRDGDYLLIRFSK
jgi:ribosome-binding ATPase YchF (GTP1/OBG family)